mgnify:CR=1 FL=1
MKKVYHICTLLIICCSPEQKKEILTSNYGYTQGTTYSIQYLSPNGKNIQNNIDSILSRVDLSLSTYQEESLISKINRNETKKLDSLYKRVLISALNIAKNTKGAFDPTIAPLVNFWGFGPKEIKQNKKSSISTLLNSVGYEKIHVNDDEIVKENLKTQLDFNGIAQGFTVDLIAEHFLKIGINDFMIEIGGELRCKGVNSQNEVWRIGIEKPEKKKNKDHFHAILLIDNLAVASSGNYRNYKIDSKSGAKFSHSINPKTGFPVKSNLLSVTILNPSCMQADAIATGCMIMGLEKSIEYVNLDSESEALMIYSGKNGELKTYMTDAIKEMSIYSNY